MCELVKIEPQPKRGAPFRISFSNRSPAYWYNEQLSWPRGNHMLFEWKCPFGVNGEPVLVDGTWYWRRTT
jgi:hypothetical protein